MTTVRRTWVGANGPVTWAGCGVTRATHLDGRSSVVTVEEDCGLDPDGARALAAKLLAAADLAEALRATEG